MEHLANIDPKQGYFSHPRRREAVSRSFCVIKSKQLGKR